jgi:hypothetical protein
MTSAFDVCFAAFGLMITPIRELRASFTTSYRLVELRSPGIAAATHPRLR